MNFDHILQAHERIRQHLHRTPILSSRLLNQLTGSTLSFKAENLQKVGAFKARGALNAVLSLPPAARARGLATHSSGNHGAALAFAGQQVGAQVHVVIPEDASPHKIAAVRGYGAEVILCGTTLESRDQTCQELLQRTGATLIHPYDDDAVIAGQGTAALEFLQDSPPLDILMTPIGGGGLIAGSALAAKHLAPATQVFGAEPTASGDAYHSWKSGQHLAPQGTDTIADGLRAGIGHRNVAILHQAVDQVLMVSEQAIAQATRLLLHYLKTVVEPSAAVPLAAVLEHPQVFAHRQVGIILSGGNLNLDALPWNPLPPS